MKFAKTIRFDKSDLNIFPSISEEGELAVVGTFSFFNIPENKILGKTKQAFSNGFLGIPSFGYSTFISITEVNEDELAKLKNKLTEQFLNVYKAPSPEHASRAAKNEINLMNDLCKIHENGSLLTISREFKEGNIKENFRNLPKSDSCAEQKIWTFQEDKIDE